MLSITKDPQQTRVPWMATARTGWATKQAPVGSEHREDCRDPRAACARCGNAMCVCGERYLSEDRRWTI